MQQPILVTGATGRYGEPVARHLKEKGFQVRVMSRSEASARKRFDESYEVATGDVTDLNSLEKAISGCDGVHISVSGEAEQIGTENVVKVATEQGLQRITYVSGTATFEENARFPVLKKKLLAEKAIRESGIPYTILAPAFAMEVLPMHIQGSKAYVFGKQPHPFHWLAADDLGRMVATVYGTDETMNKRLFIYGPENLSIHEALLRYCAVLHPEIRKTSTMPFWLANIIAKLTRNQVMATAVEVYTFYEKVGGDGGDPTEAKRLLGEPKITIEKWLERKQGK
ncbi:NAD(P)H-binding protein [Chloroflexi bacterium TSY]|nr:NAD(P)H-binding protein [Chloroflexi bacterium TSY]